MLMPKQRVLMDSYDKSQNLKGKLVKNKSRSKSKNRKM